jgi:cold shock CspA family protein
MLGKMIYFDENQDFGFIRTEEGERLYVDRKGFSEAAPVGRCAGIDVSFEVHEDADGREAVGVSIVPEPDRKRARRRRSGSY